jgi:hypothetical protein
VEAFFADPKKAGGSPLMARICPFAAMEKGVD